MEKKAVWITLIVLCVLFVIQIPFNFHNNAYYYATHTHYKKINIHLLLFWTPIISQQIMFLNILWKMMINEEAI